MTDVQSQKDPREIPIDKVGVKNLSYPIVVFDKANREQHTIATIDMYVDLSPKFRGTHMSRFVEILNEFLRNITMRNVGQILHRMKERLHSETAHLEIAFPYFIEKAAPVSGAKSLMKYDCKFIGIYDGGLDSVLSVTVPLTTLCPCSKALGERGAHNQRGVVSVSVRSEEFVWIEDLVNLVESCGSSEVYSLLKRSDEKYVTEEAYDTPKFVEDVVRDVAEKLSADPNILWFSVESENFESIHNHSAYAHIEHRRDEQGRMVNKVSSRA